VPRAASTTPAFEILRAPGGVRVPLLVHVPHSSTHVPDDLRASIALDDERLEAELLAMTDRFTDQLFAGALDLGGLMFVNRTSRLVVDPERFPADAEEPMAARGMGAVYRRTADGAHLRPGSFGPADRERLMQRFFEPYSAALEATVTELLEQFGACLIVDGHSFPSSALPYEDPALLRPEVCLGHEPFHIDPQLPLELEEVLRAHDVEVAHNQPFAGSYVPLRHYRRDRRVRSVMMELRRDLYMDEATGERAPGFGGTRTLVDELLACVARSQSTHSPPEPRSGRS
jgi:N-formylglutamate deformylase